MGSLIEMRRFLILPAKAVDLGPNFCREPDHLVRDAPESIICALSDLIADLQRYTVFNNSYDLPSKTQIGFHHDAPVPWDVIALVDPPFSGAQITAAGGMKGQHWTGKDTGSRITADASSASTWMFPPTTFATKTFDDLLISSPRFPTPVPSAIDPIPAPSHVRHLQVDVALHLAFIMVFGFIISILFCSTILAFWWTCELCLCAEGRRRQTWQEGLRDRDRERRASTTFQNDRMTSRINESSELQPFYEAGADIHDNNVDGVDRLPGGTLVRGARWHNRHRPGGSRHVEEWLHRVVGRAVPSATMEPGGAPASSPVAGAAAVQAPPHLPRIPEEEPAPGPTPSALPPRALAPSSGHSSGDDSSDYGTMCCLTTVFYFFCRD